MDIKDLESKIAIRADEEVQRKIKEFKRILDAGLNQLFETSAGIGGHTFGSYGYFEGRSEPHSQSGVDKLEVLKLAICDKQMKADGSKAHCPWPQSLWQAEREKIRNDLLEKMDLMQRLLLTKKRISDDDVPEGIEQ